MFKKDKDESLDKIDPSIMNNMLKCKYPPLIMIYPANQM